METDSIEPVSMDMYIRAGMLPRIPMFEWDGPVPDSLPDTPENAPFHSGDSPEQMDEIDRKVIGCQRSMEHQFWMKKRGLELEILSHNCTPTGYVYFSKKGKIGPAAATAELLMQPLVLRAVRRSRELGACHVHLKIPGHSLVLQSVAASMCLRVQAPAASLLAASPLWPLGQCLLSGSDSLLV